MPKGKGIPPAVAAPAFGILIENPAQGLRPVPDFSVHHPKTKHNRPKKTTTTTAKNIGIAAVFGKSTAKY